MEKEVTAPSEAQAAALQITKQRLKDWSACGDGYQWFVKKFPQGAQFSEVYDALREDRRYSDGDWLVRNVFAELDVVARVRETVSITGANKEKIEDQVKVCGGSWANAATTGSWANAATTGEGANAATTGSWANAATTGEGANAATTGYRANAATTGSWANAATTGYRANAATTGEGAIAAALGFGCKAKASSGGAIVLVNRDSNWVIQHIRAARVGEHGIKPDVWYSLDEKGEFVEEKE